MRKAFKGVCLVPTFAAAVVLIASGQEVRAADVNMPIVMPITGYLSVEGASTRNGAVMAFEESKLDVKLSYEVFDTGTSATGAALALEKAVSDGDAVAVPASIFGTEMIAMAPVALEYKVPLLTTSGTAKITESGNPYIFRFLPNDRKIKVAHARYIVEELGLKHPALVGDSTAYGQGGQAHLAETFGKLGVKLAYEENIAYDLKDMTALLDKVKRSNADVLVLHMIAHPMALIVKQARAMGIEMPIVTSSSIVAPTSTALFEPAELGGLCAETPSSPESRATPEMKAWADKYAAKFGVEPDGLALGQYDGVKMALQMIADGARTAEDMRAALSKVTYKGVAMTYKSDGKGDMAHDADIACYDGKSRVPYIAHHYTSDELVID